MRTYSTFLIRCWQSMDTARYVVQHGQSGAQFQSTDFAGISRWIAQINSTLPDTPGGPDDDEPDTEVKEETP
jgi:hypothetical protein